MPSDFWYYSKNEINVNMKSKNTEISLLAFGFMHFIKNLFLWHSIHRGYSFESQYAQSPPVLRLCLFLILFLIPFIQILSTFLIQDLFYLLCQQIISEHPAYALSGDPASFKLLEPPIQVQFPHVEPYDHQIKYNFYRSMAVTVLCMV